MRIFVQGENIAGVQVVEVSEAIQVREALSKFIDFGFPVVQSVEEVWIGFEETENGLQLDEWIQLEADKDIRIHAHRCHRITVTCSFNGDSRTKEFAPSTTIKSVKNWVTGPDGFGMSALDAADHVLQVCGGEMRPSEHVHIGALVHHPDCTLCLQLLPADRHQG